MFGPRTAAATYAAVDLETKVASASRHELIQMLFDGAILALNQACAALGTNDTAAKGQATSRAVSIIEDGLRASLDKKHGGALAESLDGLYDYMARQVLLSSMRGNVSGFLEAKKLLNDLHDAWSSIGRQPAGQTSSSSPLLTALPGGCGR